MFVHRSQFFLTTVTVLVVGALVLHLRRPATTTTATVRVAAATIPITATAFQPADRTSFMEQSRQQPAALRQAWTAAADHDEARIEACMPLLEKLCQAGRFSEACDQVLALEPAGPAQKADLLARILAQWGERDPVAGAAWARQIPDDFLRENAVRAAGAVWAEHDPVAATDFAAGLPAGMARRETLAQAVANWLTIAPNAAGDWLVRHEADPELDPVFTAIATTAKAAPQQALEWAGFISDPLARNSAQLTILLEWSNWDPKAAMARAGTVLDPEVQDQFWRHLEASLPLGSPDSPKGLNPEIRSTP